MRYALFLLLVLPFVVSGQALRDINYNYQYDPDEPFSMNIKPIRTNSGWTAHYHFVLHDSAQRIEQYFLQWELRSTLDERQGQTIQTDALTKELSNNSIKGRVTVASTSEVQYLAVRVLNNVAKRVWYFYKTLGSQISHRWIFYSKRRADTVRLCPRKHSPRVAHAR